jgi:hypothetical protein
MSHSSLFPREFTSCQTGGQPSGRGSGSGHSVTHSFAQLDQVVWGEIGRGLAHLRPHKFHRIEFWSTDRKPIDMHTRILGQKLLHQLTFVDGMVIPHQNDLAWNDLQHLLQESHHLFAAQTASIGTGGQTVPTLPADKECTQQVQALVMLQTGPQGGRMAAGRPTPLERRDQREATFIFKDQRRSPLTPLFLSLARPCVSRRQSSPRRVGSPVAVASDCSNPSDPSHARLRWEHTECQTAPRSHVRSVPASSNLRRTRGHRLHATTLVPTSAVVPQSAWWVGRGSARSSWAGDLAVLASERRSEWSRPRVGLLHQLVYPHRVISAPASVFLPELVGYVCSACAYYGTSTAFHDSRFSRFNNK